MSLNSTQIATLKAFVAASSAPAIVTARTAGATVDLMALLNADDGSNTSAWRDAVPAKDMDGQADYAAFDSLVAGKRDAWSLFLQYAPRDMSLGKLRKVVTDVWGPATAGSIAESILSACVEPASVAELALGGATGTTGSTSALKRNWVGNVTQVECQLILAP